MDPSERSVYLTFDDGPIPESTPFLLETLRRYGVKATFFVVGENVQKHPDLIQQIIDDGHKVGNHTYHHLGSFKHWAATYLIDTFKCQQAISPYLTSPRRGGTVLSLENGVTAKASPTGRGWRGLWLCTSPDPVKDQTDFLAQIYDWQLEKALFPIGHYVKDEVRQIAEREHLVSAHRRDSQGICFLGKINYNDYVRRYLGEQPGDVIELETGRRIGEHRGLWFHTIGQRKGMGCSGGPWFVVKKDVAQNILYVSHGYDPATAYKQEFPIHDFHSINGQLPPERITIKIRHTPQYLPARLTPTGAGCYTVRADAPIHGVAPGQFCVVYDEWHHRCYGSGEITVFSGC